MSLADFFCLTMAKKQNPVIQLVMSAAAYGGRTVGRFDGKAVFVPFALPGEIVKVEITAEFKNHSEARLVEVVKPSPLRMEAPCPQFGVCGGCHYQHIPYVEQLQLKQRIFTETLQRIAKLKDPVVLPILPSPLQFVYRNNMQYHLDESGRCCFYPEVPETPLVPGAGCLLATDNANTFLKDLELDGSAGIDRVSVREGDGDLMLVLESEEVELPDLSIEADVSVVHIAEEDTVVISGNEAFYSTVKGKPFRVSAGSFFQVNTQAAGVMVDSVLALADWKPTDVVMDLYCGVGLFSAFLAPMVGKVIGVEVGQSSCADFEYNLDAFDNVELYEGAAEEILPHLKQKVDIIVVDPPRAGLDKKVVEAAVRLAPTKIIYVSCDPTTLARDIARFTESGYELASAQPLDMFPQTYHIESVSLLVRKGAKG